MRPQRRTADSAHAAALLLPRCAPSPPLCTRTSPPQTTFILFEAASGFGLFEVKEFDEISQGTDKVQEAVR
jgi:hypothetical protein